LIFHFNVMTNSSDSWLKVLSLAQWRIPIMALRNAWIRNRRGCIAAMLQPEPEVALKQVCARWLGRYERMKEIGASDFLGYAALCGILPSEAAKIWMQYASGSEDRIPTWIHLPELCVIGWRLVVRQKRELLAEPQATSADNKKQAVM